MTKNNLPPVHPGKIIADAIEDMGLSQREFADIIGISKQYVSDIINGRKGLSDDICFLLPPAIGSTPEMWMRLQQTYDCKIAEKDVALQKKVREVRVRAEKYKETILV
jgi:addiction module HigA family antidote